MDTVDQVFGSFGGPTALAGAVGIKTSAASEMKRRGSIPVRYWPSLIDAAQERGIEGITYEKLALMHAAKAEAAQ